MNESLSSAARRSPRRRPRLAIAIHALRVALVMALLLAIPSPVATTVSDGSVPPPLSLVQRVLPDAAAVDSEPNTSGLWPVRNDRQNAIAFLARTLPIAKGVVGYRGPSEAMIVFTPDLEIVAVRLIESADTEEHVEAMVSDELFFEQFQGWLWGGPRSDQTVDAVSGATLTSMALAEGVIKRIGGDRPSLIFPDALTVEDVAAWFPDAASIDEQSDIALVKDDAGQVIGRVMRTGRFRDDITGYQGPTELLIRLSESDEVEKVRIRRSYDNEPYVDYVRTEYGFWQLFQGKSLDQMADLDVERDVIEGVSGATMTSVTVAETLIATAKIHTDPDPAVEADTTRSRRVEIRWSSADVATLIVLVVMMLLTRLHRFRKPVLRRVWLASITMVIGLWAGNLVSMALISGWSAEGIAWRLAPGLTAITAVALLVPPVSKGNPYCNHLCPHGAVQQLVRPGRRSRFQHLNARPLTKRLVAILTHLPGLMLATAYVALLIYPSIDLSAWEPFHAYLFRIAGWGSIALAVGTIALAAVIPMGYCRLGCPTGRLIDYLRRSATSDRLRLADGVAVALFCLAIMIRLGGK